MNQGPEELASAGVHGKVFEVAPRLDLSAPYLPLRKGRYDIAVCVEGIEHLENQWNLVRNLNRALKPGGHLVLTTRNILDFRSRLRYLAEGQ